MRNEYIADVCCDVPSMTVEKSSGGRWDSDRSAGRRCATGLGLPVIPLVIRKNIVPHLCDSRSPQGEGENFLRWMPGPQLSGCLRGRVLPATRMSVRILSNLGHDANMVQTCQTNPHRPNRNAACEPSNR